MEGKPACVVCFLHCLSTLVPLFVHSSVHPPSKRKWLCGQNLMAECLKVGKVLNRFIVVLHYFSNCKMDFFPCLKNSCLYYYVSEEYCHLWNNINEEIWHIRVFEDIPYLQMISDFSSLTLKVSNIIFFNVIYHFFSELLWKLLLKNRSSGATEF